MADSTSARRAAGRRSALRWTSVDATGTPRACVRDYVSGAVSATTGNTTTSFFRQSTTRFFEAFRTGSIETLFRPLQAGLKPWRFAYHGTPNRISFGPAKAAGSQSAWVPSSRLLRRGHRTNRRPSPWHRVADIEVDLVAPDRYVVPMGRGQLVGRVVGLERQLDEALHRAPVGEHPIDQLVRHHREESGADGRQALVMAICARLDVLGFKRLEYELIPDAIDLGLDAGLPPVIDLGSQIAEFGRGERRQVALRHLNVPAPLAHARPLRGSPPLRPAAPGGAGAARRSPTGHLVAGRAEYLTPLDRQGPTLRPPFRKGLSPPRTSGPYEQGAAERLPCNKDADRRDRWAQTGTLRYGGATCCGRPRAGSPTRDTKP